MLRTRYHVFRAEIRRNCTVGVVLHPYRAKLKTDRSLGRMCYGRTAVAISRIGYDRYRGVFEFWTLHVWPENVARIVKASRPRWESTGLLAIRSEAGRKGTEIIKTLAAGIWSAFDLRVPQPNTCACSLPGNSNSNGPYTQRSSRSFQTDTPCGHGSRDNRLPISRTRVHDRSTPLDFLG